MQQKTKYSHRKMLAVVNVFLSSRFHKFPNLHWEPFLYSVFVQLLAGFGNPRFIRREEERPWKRGYGFRPLAHVFGERQLTSRQGNFFLNLAVPNCHDQSLRNFKWFQGPVSRMSRKLFGPEKPFQNP